MPPDEKHGNTRPPNDYCAIGLCNPKTPANVGAVVRACGCFSADSIFYTGTRYPRASRYATDTSNTVASLPPIHVDSLTEKLPAATKIVCIELAENAIALPDFTHPKRCIYIFGAEDYNLSQTTIDRADHTVFIPTSGCLNLAASVNIVLYDRYQKVHHQTMPVAQRNKLVRNSRDCRNNLRVKNPQTTSQ